MSYEPLYTEETEDMEFEERNKVKRRMAEVQVERQGPQPGGLA